MPAETTVYGNGILADSGQYGVTMSVDELYELIQAERSTVDEKEKDFVEVQTKGRETKSLGPPPSVSPNDLAQARWGIIWPPEPLTAEEKAHEDALKDLIARRRQQMCGKEPHQFHYQPGWAYDDFLWEEAREVEPGDMEPDIVPYYLCIVGSPERIPWEFQQYLDGEYAMGRLWFDDPADCGRYVEHLLKYETRKEALLNVREALFVGPNNHNDRPTQESATQLVKPLHDWLIKEAQLKFQTSLLLGDEQGREASKAHLVQRLEGKGPAGQPQAPPALLFTASHGLEHEKPSETQFATQGALICQEWPGGLATPQPNHYLAGDMVSEEMNLEGMVAFCFACYSAGTPLRQDWVRKTLFRKPAQIALKPFVASLPQRLLAHGLLALVGHVSRAWDFSFLGARGSRKHLGSFREPIGQLLRGQPVGHATDYLNERWPKLTVQLDRQLANKKKYGKERPIATWKARNDCRGYAILGDPAAKLRIELLK